ncbi:MAG: VWA domain-containing protein, partial [Alistipes sp.]|nr:VWA domain-containing protein [Alistipes sp.]
MHFASPHLLWLLGAIPLLVLYALWRARQGRASICISTVDGALCAPRTWRYCLRPLPLALRTAAVALLIVALARPQSAEESSTRESEGIDIVLAIDISTSMLARDLEPDRIQAAKQVAGSFIADRPGDRIGLVAFAGEAFTQSPLTTDQGTLQTLLGRLRSGVIEDGTAIGNGLATALNRLRESEAKSKVVILLTDGENNRGEIAPLMAAEIARDQGVRVYTIGVGTHGTAPYPTVDYFGNPTLVQAQVRIDEQTLSRIAELTGGRYFRATDNDKLRAIYDE